VAAKALEAQPDRDIELGGGLRNQLTQRAGEYFVLAEVNRRGGVATAFSGNLLGIDIIAFDHTRSREVYIQVKTKTHSRFVWHMQVPDESLPEPKEEREFYVFVDLGTGANASPGYWIAPRFWIQNEVYDRHHAWIKKRGGSRPRTADSKHSGPKSEHLEKWKDRWDALRIGLKLAPSAL
jgi:hypothetical protein